MPAPGLDAGGDGEAGDRVAYHLTLTAAQTADGIAHEEDLGEVVAAQAGTAEALSRAELALDRDTVARVQPEVGGVAVRGVRVLRPSAGTVELILEFHR